MDHRLINLLKTGGVAVIPTDTIYGIVGSAFNPQTVEQIYKLRKRAKDKPMIILISNLNDLNQFNIQLTAKQKKFLQKNWPNPLSVVLPCTGEKFKYLHRGTSSLAFRMPKNEKLLLLLREVGPLVAPSANFEGEQAAKTADQAKAVFQKQISFYLDAGRLISKPSTVIQLSKDGSWKIFRQGQYQTL